MSLTSETEEQVTAWLFGIQSILVGDGKKFKLNEPAKVPPSLLFVVVILPYATPPLRFFLPHEYFPPFTEPFPQAATGKEQRRRYSRSFSVIPGADEDDDDPDFYPEQPYKPYAEKVTSASWVSKAAGLREA